MSDLIEFLTARLDDKQQMAQAIAEHVLPRHMGVEAQVLWQWHERMLREVEAMRMVVEMAATIMRSDIPVPDGSHKGAADALGLVLAAWATVYSDHPDYLQEWKL